MLTAITGSCRTRATRTMDIGSAVIVIACLAVPANALGLGVPDTADDATSAERPSRGEADADAATLEAVIREGRLAVGDSVQVTVSGERMKGVILEAGPTGLVLTDDWGVGRLSVAEADIVRIERRDPLKNGAWWGFAIGWGVALALVYPSCSYDGEQCGLLAAGIASPGAGIGAGIGTLVDALLYENIYRRTLASRVTVTPSASRGSVGARLSVAW